MFRAKRRSSSLMTDRSIDIPKFEAKADYKKDCVYPYLCQKDIQQMLPTWHYSKNLYFFFKKMKKTA
jgi:hypothetical protein